MENIDKEIEDMYFILSIDNAIENEFNIHETLKDIKDEYNLNADCMNEAITNISTVLYMKLFKELNFKNKEL